MAQYVPYPDGPFEKKQCVNDDLHMRHVWFDRNAKPIGRYYECEGHR